jgi:predicted glutamine amidotransferase
MCRLLAFVAARPRTLGDVLGPSLRDFTDLSRQRHSDGWGMAWPDGDRMEVRKAPDVASDSEEFARLGATVSTDALLVHLRWATMGLGLSTANTHPFDDGHVAFAHNGSVASIEGLDAMIDERLAGERQGTTDSERLWLAVRSRASGVDLATALAETIGLVAATLPYSSLNCMVLTPERLHVACRFDPRAIAGDDGSDYYELRYRVTPDAVVIGSSGWPQDGWQLLGNGEMLTVERGSLAVSVTALPAPEAIH